jgi:hypothetical protein
MYRVAELSVFSSCSPARAVPAPGKAENAFVKRLIFSLLNRKTLAAFSPQRIMDVWSTIEISLELKGSAEFVGHS